MEIAVDLCQVVRRLQTAVNLWQLVRRLLYCKPYRARSHEPGQDMSYERGPELLAKPGAVEQGQVLGAGLADTI
jgi:hypothetical protein